MATAAQHRTFLLWENFFIFYSPIIIYCIITTVIYEYARARMCVLLLDFIRSITAYTVYIVSVGRV